MRYFAYGSNMSIPRLKKRVPSAKLLGIYKLFEHQLRFHKKSSMDGSGKCDAFFTGDQSNYIIGLLFEIDPKDKKNLDIAEGLNHGYSEKKVVLKGISIEENATTYYATNIDPLLKPYSWYLNHVLKGATKANFPQEYIDMLMRVESIEDPDKKRDYRERSIY